MGFGVMGIDDWRVLVELRPVEPSFDQSPDFRDETRDSMGGFAEIVGQSCAPHWEWRAEDAIRAGA